MKVIILAGGKATRLYPTTLIMPKQLVMIDGYPVIHYLLRHCLSNGIRDVTICLSDLALKSEFSHALEGRYKGLALSYSITPESYGTAGRISAAARTLRAEAFVVYYGDIISTFPLARMLRHHRNNRNKPICTLAVTKDVEVEFGVASVEIDSNRISKFVERPKISAISNCYVNVGVAVCDSRVIAFCKNRADFFRDTIPEMISKGEMVCAFQIARFIDIGTFNSIDSARDFLKSQSEFVRSGSGVKS